MISVLILTKNEERDLPGCLESVSWSDDIHVYDSLSTDRTTEIARAHGATVTRRGFDNWSSHQNWGLQHVPFRHPWVLYLDADERVTPALREGLLAAVAAPGDRVAFRIERHDHFMGRWLRHVQATSSYIRLFMPSHVRYERLVNPVTLVDGPVGDASGHLDHFPFSKGIDQWFERHNGYSRMEAQQIIADRAAGKTFSLAKALFSGDAQERRHHQKELFHRLPFRPTLQFLLLYVAKLGFLDGTAGYTYARMRSIYEAMIEMKIADILRTQPAAQIEDGRSGYQVADPGLLRPMMAAATPAELTRPSQNT
jgi:glycosyltransferase involved in cell wall biosynthesis